MNTASAPAAASGGPTRPARPKGLRGLLRGPRLVSRQGFAWLVVIFLLILVVFGIAFYEFITHLPPAPSAPIQFSVARMVAGNATFNVTAAGNNTFVWKEFSVNLSVNNFGGTAVPLAASDLNATIVIGSEVYHVIWIDRDRDGRVSAGDVFWVTGDRARLPSLSYCQFRLRWNPGSWAAVEYWTTSPSIV